MVAGHHQCGPVEVLGAVVAEDRGEDLGGRQGWGLRLGSVRPIQRVVVQGLSRVVGVKLLTYAKADAAVGEAVGVRGDNPLVGDVAAHLGCKVRLCVRTVRKLDIGDKLCLALGIAQVSMFASLDAYSSLYRRILPSTLRRVLRDFCLSAHHPLGDATVGSRYVHVYAARVE